MPTPDFPSVNNEGGEPPEQGNGNVFVSNAYETISTWSWQSKLAAVAALLILSMMLGNIMFTDYNSQTRDYLKSIGREDVLTQVIPPTASDIRMAQYAREVLITQLATNMTIVMQEVGNLRRELDLLKGKSA